MLHPNCDWREFVDEEEKIEKLKSWGIPITKDVTYKGIFAKEPVKCDIIGYALVTEPSKWLRELMDEQEMEEHMKDHKAAIIKIDEELNLRTEIARLIEKRGYKNYVLVSKNNDSKVVLD